MWAFIINFIANFRVLCYYNLKGLEGVEFCIKIADIIIQIEPLFNSTYLFCKSFLCNDKPDFSVKIEMSDIAYERQRAKLTDIKEGRKSVNFSDNYLETLAVYRKIAEKINDYNAFLFHGSAVSVDGVGYLFTAKSGTGKSTHTGFYREVFGERAVMVNDDKPIIALKNNKAFVCGTPWCGKHNLGNNIIVPLKAICVLSRGDINSINEVNYSDILENIIGQSYRPENSKNLFNFMETISKLVKCVKFYKLKCNLNCEAALVSYNGMNRE